MLNRVIVIGRLTADPVLRYTQSGLAVCSFILAVDRPFKGQNGEKETDFLDVQTWRKLGENCANFLTKGKMAAVDGRIQVRSYEAKDGSKRKAVEIVAENVAFLSPKDKGQENGSIPEQGVNEDDLPF